MAYGCSEFRFAFKSEFNSAAKVLALWAMKNNVSSAANSFTVDTLWFDTDDLISLSKVKYASNILQLVELQKKKYTSSQYHFDKRSTFEVDLWN